VGAEVTLETPWPWGPELTEIMVWGYPCTSYVRRRKHLRELLRTPDVSPTAGTWCKEVVA